MKKNQQHAHTHIPGKNTTTVKICFVAHYAYRAITGSRTGHIGGVERQISLMAKWFAKRGHRVSVIVWDEGQPDEFSVDGLEVLKVCRMDAGFPGIRFFVPRWSSLLRALKIADADVYYHNCAEYITGQVALWTRRNHKKFIYSIASDPECDPALLILPSYREKILFRIGLRIANAVIAQSKEQKSRLLEGFKRHATPLPMPCDSPNHFDTGNDVGGPPGNKVLWLGRIDPVKRVEVILSAARECPDIGFDIVGPPGNDAAYVARINSDAQNLPNVTMHGAVNFSEVDRFYLQAAALCCTSRFEGFPNTFLEAWSFGVPVITTVDPDGLIGRLSLGAAVFDPKHFGASVRELLADKVRLTAASRNARIYFSENHEKNAAMRRFESFFEMVVQERYDGLTDNAA